MKQLKCEMCGGTNLVKTDGVFVCQNCGTKYSIEEARKMMIEGTVDVSGSTVKVDTSSELDNLYQIARRAKADNNSVNAAKYYDLILVKDPTSWEAAFYVVYFQAMQCKIAQIQSAAISVSNCEDTVLALIKEHVPKVAQYAAVQEVTFRSGIIAKILADGAKNNYDELSSDIKSKHTQEYVDRSSAARDIMYTCGTQIERIFGDKPEIAKLAAEAWKAGIGLHESILPLFANTAANKRIIASYIDKIGKYDSDYYKKRKSEILKEEIASLEQTIRNTKTDTAWDKKSLGLGIFFLIPGIIFFVLIVYWGIYDSVFVVLVTIAFLFFGVGLIVTAKPKKEIIAENIKTVEEAKKSLDEKQDELKSLTK